KSGKIIDQQSQKGVAGLLVYLSGHENQGVTSDAEGNFSLEIPESLLNQESIKIYIKVNDDIKLPHHTSPNPDENIILPIPPMPHTRPRIDKPEKEEETAVPEEEASSEPTPPETSSPSPEAVADLDSVDQPEEMPLEISNKKKENNSVEKITSAFNRIESKLVQEKLVIAQQNKAIQEDIRAIYQQLTDQGQLSNDQKDDLLKRLAALEKQLEENMIAYQRLQSSMQAEIDRTKEFLLGNRNFIYLNQRVIITFLSIVAIILFFAGLAFFIIQKLRTQKKQLEISNEEINQKNEEIAAQRDELQNVSEKLQASLLEKETLLKEIHHRVKNNLQVISSLFNLQSKIITDPVALEAIRDGQSRVQSMALIHQKLYQSDTLSSIDFQEYLKQLVQSIADTYRSHDTDVQYDLDAHQIQLDIDTAIPLGLIINELVSNSYKYAFSENNEGLIKIEVKAGELPFYTLKVSDNGKGLPKDLNLEKVNSLGLKLVNILSRQLRGTVEILEGPGTVFFIHFKDIGHRKSA
ncbi:MAG: histidine kinase dimerization/phosphoacceptor domain -containing protein, partial [Bacteroidota bacterium]